MKGGGRVKRTIRGGGIDATTSRRMRDDHGGGKSIGNGEGKCHALPSRDLAVTALVLAAEAAAALIADDTDGNNSRVAIVGSASLGAGGGVIN